jgi:membrane protease YdiL (CAAX protease family)
MTIAASTVSGIQSSKARAWLTAIVLGLAVPIAIVIMMIGLQFVPLMKTGTHVERYCLIVTATCLAEWIVLVIFLLFRKSRLAELREIGLFRFGTWSAWLIALGITALAVFNSLNILHRMGHSSALLWQPSLFHIYAALLLGTTAAICEEILFRGYLMTFFAKAGYGKVVQVIVPGIAFGMAPWGFRVSGGARCHRHHDLYRHHGDDLGNRLSCRP